MTNVEEAVKRAVSPLFPCEAGTYTGTALEYVTWTVYQLPQVYGEHGPAAARYPVMVHYWLPHGKNPNPGKLRISKALFDQGFTWPSVTNASDGDGQHYVFECNYVNGGGVYGQT